MLGQNLKLLLKMLQYKWEISPGVSLLDILVANSYSRWINIHQDWPVSKSGFQVLLLQPRGRWRAFWIDKVENSLHFRCSPCFLHDVLWWWGDKEINHFLLISKYNLKTFFWESRNQWNCLSLSLVIWTSPGSLIF